MSVLTVQFKRERSRTRRALAAWHLEIMTIDADLRQAVLDGASIEEVRTAAIANGMRTLRESAMEAVSAGRTTIEELLRETMV